MVEGSQNPWIWRISVFQRRRIGVRKWKKKKKKRWIAQLPFASPVRPLLSHPSGNYYISPYDLFVSWKKWFWKQGLYLALCNLNENFAQSLFHSPFASFDYVSFCLCLVAQKVWRLYLSFWILRFKLKEKLTMCISNYRLHSIVVVGTWILSYDKSCSYCDFGFDFQNV